MEGQGLAPQGGLEPPAVGLEGRRSSSRAAAAGGTAGRDRTDTLPVRTGRLVRSSCCGVASWGGFEPPTSGSGDRRSSDWATTTTGLGGWIRTIVAGFVDRHPSVRRPREMDPAAGVGPASPPWRGGVVAVGQREDGTDDRNRTRLYWFWKPAPTQSATSVENDLLRPSPHGVRALLGSRGRLLASTVAGRDGADGGERRICTCTSRVVRDDWLATRCRR